ncbi:methyltransferase, FxLD system [Streptomyces sp. NPDC055078]
MNSSTSGDEAARLRANLVARLTAGGHLHDPAVRRAFATLPRHAFVPDATVEAAYGDGPVITHRGSDNRPTSCASEPWLVATMLEQLDVRPGQRILEIGAGTGINSALLAELAGPEGQVTTVDIDPDVTARARRALDTGGYGRVRVLTRDGALGAPDGAPYDRIIATVGVWDLPATWLGQLADDGRMVVPLRMRGTTRSIALTRDGNRLVSAGMALCGFVPMIGQEGERTAFIDPGEHVAVHWDADQDMATAALGDVLGRPRATVWSGVTVGPEEPFHGVWMRLIGTEPGTVRIRADRAAVESGLCTPAIRTLSPALVEGSSLAYFTQRYVPDGDRRRWELGSHGHGPGGQGLAGRLATQIRAWGKDRTDRATITASPAGTPDDRLPDGQVLDKTDFRVTVSV